MNILPEFIAKPAVAKPKPQVSIGMPVYNGAKFIREALDSLLAQTYTDFELIISDNASTDGTEAICREYAAKDARIRYVRQSENRGASANFQFVLDEAVGEYFMWAAADDLWDIAFIGILLSRLLPCDEANFAFCRYKGLSRFSVIFNRSFSDVLHFIGISSAHERVLTYSSLCFSTHKDNLVYSLWKRNFLKTCLDVSSISDGLNELALFLSPGIYVPQLLFYKVYRKSVPGHWSDPYLVPVIRIINWVCGRRSQSSSASSTDAYGKAMAASLLSAGAEEAFIATVCDTHRSLKS